MRFAQSSTSCCAARQIALHAKYSYSNRVYEIFMRFFEQKWLKNRMDTALCTPTIVLSHRNQRQ
jgi:hypothetical protein